MPGGQTRKAPARITPRKEMAMNYEAGLDAALNQLHDEGRYRTFTPIERHRGDFPRATWTKTGKCCVPTRR